jgi:hypothetical protein
METRDTESVLRVANQMFACGDFQLSYLQVTQPCSACTLCACRWCYAISRDYVQQPHQVIMQPSLLHWASFLWILCHNKHHRRAAATTTY